MKKNGETTEGRVYILKWVNTWHMLDWILSQNCRNTLPLHTVDQLMQSAKNETLFYPSKLRIRHRIDGLISDCKCASFTGYCLKFSKAQASSMKFKPDWRLAEGSVECG